MADDAPTGNEAAPAVAPAPAVTPAAPTQAQPAPKPNGPWISDKAYDDWAVDAIAAKRKGDTLPGGPKDYVEQRGEPFDEQRGEPFEKPFTEREAYEYDKARREENAAYERQNAADAAAWRERRADEDIRATRQFSQDDLQRSQAFQQGYANFEAKKANLWQRYEAAIAEAAKVYQQNPAAGQQMAAEVRRRANAEAEVLEQEKTAFEIGGQAWVNHAARKNVTANVKSVVKEIPELASEAEQQRLLADVVRRSGSSREFITETLRRGLNSTDPLQRAHAVTAIKQEWAISQRERRETREGSFNAALARHCRDHGVGQRVNRDPPKNLEELRAYAQKHGDMASNTALRIWMKKADTARRQGNL